MRTTHSLRPNLARRLAAATVLAAAGSAAVATQAGAAIPTGPGSWTSPCLPSCVVDPPVPPSTTTTLKVWPGVFDPELFGDLTVVTIDPDPDPVPPTVPPAPPAPEPATPPAAPAPPAPAGGGTAHGHGAGTAGSVSDASTAPVVAAEQSLDQAVPVAPAATGTELASANETGPEAGEDQGTDVLPIVLLLGVAVLGAAAVGTVLVRRRTA